MFGIDLVSLVVGIALGATFPVFFKSTWEFVKTTNFGKKVLGWFSSTPKQ